CARIAYGPFAYW
nr:immunoglobulin heavy chain junction region [Mus musculus]